MKRFRMLLPIVIIAGALSTHMSRPTGLWAQAPERLPSFEVASVKPSTGRTGEQGLPGGRYVATRSVKFFIADAFFFGQPLAMSRVIGGPDWIESAVYEINAKASTPWQQSPDGPPRELFLMIRSLLQERFKLKAHMETRELPIYELVIARADRRLGPEMRTPAADCDAAIATGIRPPRQPGEPPPCGLMGGPARTIAGGATMQQVAANLSERLDRIVVDKTGLAGRYAFNLAWTPERMPDTPPPPGVPPIDPNGPSIFTALQEQLGLKLQPARGPLEVLVIDNVERPTVD